MQSNRRNAILILAMAAALIPVALFAQQAATAYTGVVSDEMCGAKHTMDPGHSDADCTRLCAKDGAPYALVVGEKSYTLSTTDKKQLATLYKYAGRRVVVKGTLDGETLAVSAVVPDSGK